jgi:hypothetical protein
MRKKRAGESTHPQGERYRTMLLLGFARFGFVAAFPLAIGGALVFRIMLPHPQSEYRKQLLSDSD